MSSTGFIYIGGDKSKPLRAKVGQTQRQPALRISETTNPDYYLYNSYETHINKLNSTEHSLHRLLSKQFHRVKFPNTGRYSEWFDCSPQEADKVCAQYFNEQKSLLEKRQLMKEKSEAFILKKNAALEYYTHHFSPLESQLKEVIDNYQKNRNIIQTKLVQKYKSNKIDMLGIPVWLATYFLPIAIFSFLIRVVLKQPFWQIFLILAGIWALIDYRSIFNMLIKEKVNNVAVQKKLGEHFPDERLDEAKLILEDLIAYQVRMKRLKMNEGFPEIKYPLPLLKQRIKLFQSDIINQTKDYEPKAGKPTERKRPSYKQHHSDDFPTSIKSYNKFNELEQEVLELELEREIEKQELKKTILGVLKGLAIITLLAALVKLPKLLQYFN